MNKKNKRPSEHLATAKEIKDRIADLIAESKDSSDFSGETCRKILNFNYKMEKRRIQALVSSVEILTEDQKRFYDDWIMINIRCDNYLTFSSDYHAIYTCAIWILDAVMENEESEKELYKLLPHDKECINVGDLLYKVSHPKYSEELIASVMFVLICRNCDLNGDVLNSEDHYYPITNMYYDLNAKSKDVPTRNTYEKLISLIPEEKIRTAVEHFKESFYQWKDACFSCISPIVEKFNSLYDRFMELNDEYEVFLGNRAELVKTANKNIHNTKNLIKKSRTNHNPLHLRPSMPDNKELNVMVTSFAKDLSKSPLIQLVAEGDMIEKQMGHTSERLMSLNNELDELKKELDAAIIKRANVLTYLSAIGYVPADISKEKFDGLVPDITETLPLHDPYELCFALIYLAEQNDDIPFLYGACLGMMKYQLHLMPWVEPRKFGKKKEDTEALNECKDEEADENTVADIPDWNKKVYGTDKKKVSLSEIIYNETGYVMPRDLHRFDSKLGMLNKYGIKDDLANSMLYIMTIFDDMKTRKTALNFDEEYYSGEEIKSKLELMEDTFKLEAENEKLKADLREAQKSLAKSEKKLSEIKEKNKADLRELAELRELIFINQNENTEDNEDTITDSDMFPYEVKNNTVVFSGHDKWINVMKKLVTGKIRFININNTFDKALLKNTKTIWMHTYTMNHSSYYRIINASKNLPTDVHILLYQGTSGCALQVAEYDKDLK